MIRNHTSFIPIKKGFLKREGFKLCLFSYHIQNNAVLVTVVYSPKYWSCSLVRTNWLFIFYRLSGQNWFKNLLDLPKTGLPTEHEDSFPLTLMVSGLGTVWRNACHCLPTQQCFFYLLMQWLLDSTQNSDSAHSCKTRPSQFIKFRLQDRKLKGYRPRCPILVEQLSCPPIFWGLLPWH